MLAILDIFFLLLEFSIFLPALAFRTNPLGLVVCPAGIGADCLAQ